MDADCSWFVVDLNLLLLLILIVAFVFNDNTKQPWFMCWGLVVPSTTITLHQGLVNGSGPPDPETAVLAVKLWFFSFYHIIGSENHMEWVYCMYICHPLMSILFGVFQPIEDSMVVPCFLTVVSFLHKTQLFCAHEIFSTWYEDGLQMAASACHFKILNLESKRVGRHCKKARGHTVFSSSGFETVLLKYTSFPKSLSLGCFLLLILYHF